MTAVRAKVRPKLLTIKQAAEILGVAEVTLLRWDSAGKFRAKRYPMSNYRLYAEKDDIRLRDRIWAGRAA
jgi:DNA-binding transcriptional MerR regulator